MTITDFSILTTTDQLALLYSDGVYLAKRKLGNVHVILYQYQKLYVEIYYRKYRLVVERIRCSEHTDILEPYLGAIVIGNIID